MEGESWKGRTLQSILLKGLPPTDSLGFRLGLGLISGGLFWLQFSHPAQAVGYWSLIGSLLFLSVSYPNRFWAVITGIFGFEAGLLAGMFLGVEQHWLWLVGGYCSALLVTLLEHFRMNRKAPKEPDRPLEAQVLFREVGLGSAAGSLAATLIHSEAWRLWVLGAFLLIGRKLLDNKPRSTS